VEAGDDGYDLAVIGEGETNGGVEDRFRVVVDGAGGRLTERLMAGLQQIWPSRPPMTLPRASDTESRS
jgi:hypothetical protein